MRIFVSCRVLLAVLAALSCLLAGCASEAAVSTSQTAASQTAASQTGASHAEPASAAAPATTSTTTTTTTEPAETTTPATTPETTTPATTTTLDFAELLGHDSAGRDTTDQTGTSQDSASQNSDTQTIQSRLSAEYVFLDEIAGIWLPHIRWAISVELLEPADSSDPAQPPEAPTPPVTLRPDSSYISASAAKPFWMTAAAATYGTDILSELAPAVLCRSDNSAAAQVINLIGIDHINQFLHTQADMTDTLLLNWTFGDETPEPASERWMSLTPYTSNRTTVADAAGFYARLYRGELLNPQDTQRMLGWLAEFALCGGELATPLSLRLPAGYRVWHKAGWLPPGCCSAETATLNDFGIVVGPQETDAYAIAIATQGGEVSPENYLQQQNFISYASCRVLAAILGETTACQRDQDARVSSPAG